MRAPLLPRDPDGLVRLVAPVVVIALAVAGGLLDAMARASWATLGRDQGIFQYVAWAIGQGDVAYRDVRDVNGPVIPLVHLIFQGLGGTDEHRFRLLDLLVSSGVFLGAGALVERARDVRVPLWAVATWAALMAQYVVYGYWDTAQRESFLDWFLVLAIALQFRRKSTILAGALAVVPCLGKPTYVLVLLPMLIVAATGADRRREVGRFVLGGALGAAVPLLFLLWRGDLGAFVKISTHDVPTMYRFIWPRPASVILGMPGYSGLTAAAVATSAGLAALVSFRLLPWRALPIVLAPLLGLGSVVLQAKGFPYHFHPVTLATTFGWLVGLSAVGRAGRGAAVAGIAGALLVGWHANQLSRAAPWPGGQGWDRDRLVEFDRIDYFPNGLRDAAAFVAEHTTATDRVQTYGMDAYVLFLARRRSATPYIYAYDLNADAALHGSFDEGGLRPTRAQAEAIEAMRAEHVADLDARLRRDPPRAFVFVDRSPLVSDPDAVADLRVHCPATSRWVEEHYRPAANYEGIRVWLRNDDAAVPGQIE